MSTLNLSDDARTLMLAVGDVVLFEDHDRMKALAHWDTVRMATAAHELEEAGLIERDRTEVPS